MHLLKLLEAQLQKKTVGTLVLGEENSFREVFFEKDDAYLCDDRYSGRIDAESLEQSGLIGTSIATDSLEAILATNDLTEEILPQVLHTQGLIGEAEYSRLAPLQIQEDIIDLFLHNGDSFHFQEKRVPERLLEEGGVASRTPVPIGELIQELQKHIEILRATRRVLPSRKEIFVVTAEGMAHSQAHPEDFVLQHLFGLIDGFRDLGILVENSRFYEPFVLHRIASYLEKEYLKKTILPEIKGVQVENLPRDKVSQYLPHFRNAVRHAVNPMDAREKLAALLEKTGDLDGAVVQYNFIGDGLYRMRKPGKAIGAYQHALALRPDDLAIVEKISRIYQHSAEQELDKGNVKDAIKLLESALQTRPDDPAVFQRLVEILLQNRNQRDLVDLCDRVIAAGKKQGNPQIGVDACRQILSNLPDNPLFQKKLVNIYLDFGQIEDAAAEMAVLAMIYQQKGQKERALDLADKIRRLRGEYPEVARIHRSLAEKLGIRTRGRSRGALVVGLALGLLVVFSAYQVLGYIVWREVETSGVAFARAERISRQMAADSDPTRTPPALDFDPTSAEAQSLHMASRCRQFAQSFPISFWRPRAEHLARLHSETGRALNREREKRKAEIISTAQAWAREGDRARVQECLAPLLGLRGEDPWKGEAVRILETMRTIQCSAQDLFDRARSLEESNRWRAAYSTYRSMLKAFPRSRLGKDLKLPVLLESRPEGAEVFQLADGQSPQPLGKTPLVVRLARGEMMKVILEAPGHHPLRMELYESDGESAPFVLQRKEAWTFHLPGNLGVSPATEGDLAVLGNDAGVVTALDIAARRVRWTLQRDRVNRLVGSPVIAPEGIYVTWNDKQVWLLDREPLEPADAGRPASARVLKTAALPGLARAPSLSLESGLLLVGTLRKQISMFRRPELAPAGEIDIDEIPVHISRLSDGAVVVTTERGHILAVDLRDRAILWKRTIQSSPRIPPALVGSSVAVLTVESDLLLLDPETGSPRAILSLDDHPHVCWSSLGDEIYAVNLEGHLRRLSALDGSEQNRRYIRWKVTSLARTESGLAILHEEDGLLYVVDPQTLQPLWSARAEAPLAALACSRGHILLAEAAPAGEAAARSRILFFSRDEALPLAPTPHDPAPASEAQSAAQQPPPATDPAAASEPQSGS
ncbi:MAG: PQQ-binding-like beta-propeller repeat protein [Planctomycetes bacterium]|nr:PQQ-binding-like beta-propeller repeat protein [Planctomycetota bacterium]